MVSVLYSAKVAACLLPAVCVRAQACTCIAAVALRTTCYKPDPQRRRMLGAMITVTMWVSSQKCPPQITCPLIQPQSIGLSAAITPRAPATWPRVPPPCPKNLAKANQGTSCAWAPLSLHKDQRQTNWGGWPASIPLALLPPPQRY